MSSRYRHRRTPLAATPFPSPIEPGEIVVNTANRQIAVGDASAGTLGQPKQLIAVRFFDVTAAYVLNDMVLQAGKLYRANGNIPPGAFNATNWTDIGGSATAALVTFSPGGNVSSTNVQAAIAELDSEKASITYVDAGDAAINSSLAGYLLKAGGTMTGALTLAADPATNLQASTKQYVDGKIASIPTPSSLTVSDTPPTGVPDGALWWESDSGLLYVKYNDGNTTQWVIACPQPDINAFVQKSGDTMTGNLKISSQTHARFFLDAAAGSINVLHGSKAGKDRWEIFFGDGTPEAGGNSGSDFALLAIDDTGAGVVGNALGINRATLRATVAGDPTAPLGIATKQYVDNRFRRTRTVLNAVVSGTYTTPAGCNTLFIRMVGGGGGGGGGGTGAGAGGAGGPTTFGALSAGPGLGGIAIATGASGGAATGGDVVINGGFGGGSQSVVNGIGGHGGVSFFGGAAGSTATSNSGQSGNAPGGGGGGGSAGSNNWSGAGGGAGAYLEKLINAPAATYAYTVGYPGGGGTGGQYNGGAGASGLIIIDEYY